MKTGEIFLFHVFQHKSLKDRIEALELGIHAIEMHNIARNASKKIGESVAVDSIERKNSKTKSLVNGSTTENGVKTGSKNEESSRAESTDPIQVSCIFEFYIVKLDSI